jgi:hypothetical protein
LAFWGHANTHECCNFDHGRIEVDRGGLASVRDCIHNVAYREDGYAGNENELRDVEKTLWDVPILAVSHVENLEQRKSPQKGTRDPDQHGLLEASREMRRISVPCDRVILKRRKKYV